MLFDVALEVVGALDNKWHVLRASLCLKGRKSAVEFIQALSDGAS